MEFIVANHREILVADLTNMGRYPCVLGTPWLVQHDPTIRWALKEVVFDSSYCKETWLQEDIKGPKLTTDRDSQVPIAPSSRRKNRATKHQSSCPLGSSGGEAEK